MKPKICIDEPKLLKYKYILKGRKSPKIIHFEGPDYLLPCLYYLQIVPGPLGEINSVKFNVCLLPNTCQAL